jgi:hypothetical protein
MPTARSPERAMSRRLPSQDTIFVSASAVSGGADRDSCGISRLTAARLSSVMSAMTSTSMLMARL